MQSVRSSLRLLSRDRRESMKCKDLQVIFAKDIFAFANHSQEKSGNTKHKFITAGILYLYAFSMMYNLALLVSINAELCYLLDLTGILSLAYLMFPNICG